jgi:transposase
MFVRKKPNKSGVISVQVIDKSSGRYVVYKTIGSSSDTNEIIHLVELAKREIEFATRQAAINFTLLQELAFVDTFINQIESIRLQGPELVLGQLYKDIGFDELNEDLLKHLVIARLVYPVSKLKTTDYLFKYLGENISVDSIYRYLDKLQKNQIDTVKEISYKHTCKILGDALTVLYYDVTTLYFEAEQEDDLRKRGYNKDGKHQQPQILFGLLVGEGGYPVDYDIFEGNKYEGETLMTVIKAFEKKYRSKNLTVVADAGLLSKKNIEQLEEGGYKFILGARIKNETEIIKKKILSLKLKDGKSTIITLSEKKKLVISYSEKRAKKDAHNRKRGITKLEKLIQTDKLTKKQINNKGYNKFLRMDGEIKVELNEEKIKLDAKWDGLKGYVTNSIISKEEVIKQYRELWQIEKAFRISKSDLRIRPIYHRVIRRIEAHICIAFAACKLYKELERRLKLKKSNFSPQMAIDILKTIYEITIISLYSMNRHKRLIVKNAEQQELLEIFGVQF